MYVKCRTRNDLIYHSKLYNCLIKDPKKKKKSILVYLLKKKLEHHKKLLEYVMHAY